MVSLAKEEFDESGDPEKHFQALLSLAKEGVEKGKVCLDVLIIGLLERSFKFVF